MSNLSIQLLGYFDNNFGDDYMMKIIVNSLPEINFVIDENETVSSVICEEHNVRTEKITSKAQYPKLLITGCGFMINSNAALFTELIYFLKKKHVGDYCLGCNIEPLDNCIKRCNQTKFSADFGSHTSICTWWSICKYCSWM